jgi:hypothetical protein
MSSDNVLHQLMERRRLPVSAGRASNVRLFNFPDDGLRLDTLGKASLLEWLLPAAAVVQPCCSRMRIALNDVAARSARVMVVVIGSPFLPFFVILTPTAAPVSDSGHAESSDGINDCSGSRPVLKIDPWLRQSHHSPEPAFGMEGTGVSAPGVSRKAKRTERNGTATSARGSSWPSWRRVPNHQGRSLWFLLPHANFKNCAPTTRSNRTQVIQRGPYTIPQRVFSNGARSRCRSGDATSPWQNRDKTPRAETT